MVEPRPEVSWSKSRDAVLADCPRRYYYHYYGHLGGTQPEATPRAREILLLRHLRTRHMWAGEIVHEAIEKILRDLRAGIAPPPLGDLLREVRSQMRADFRASRERRFRRETRPASLALFEHDYGRRVSDEEWQAIAGRVDQCLTRFYGSETWASIQQMDPARHWLELEDLKRFDLDGTAVQVKLDFAHADGDEVRVIDWKTGRGRGANRLQLGCYVLYVASSRGLAVERVRGIEVNLGDGRIREHRFDESDLDAVRERIRRSIAWMRRLLRDPVENVALEQDFPVNPGPWRCRNCNFLRVCPEGEGVRFLARPAPSRPTA
jgi:CRISPR/Cas system-associated exonuclease Cas4 (RecB family)